MAFTRAYTKEQSMKFIISVASMNQKRLDGFLQEVDNARLLWPQGLHVLILGTGGDVQVNIEKWRFPIIFKRLPDKKRYYGEVMIEKVKMAEDFLVNPSIFFNTDDDYAFNPYAFKFAERIMNDNPYVNFLSLLRGPGVGPVPQVRLSGVPFMRLGSCMGGCLISRWPYFGTIVKQFFEEYPPENMFDQDFFHFLGRKTGEYNHVYTPVYFSLVQHCDLGSHYQKARGEMMRAENYDSRINPFEWITE